MPNPHPPTSPDDLRRLPILLRHAWYGLNQAFRRRIKHTGVTPDQFTVLRTLTESDSKGLTQRDITNKMGSDPNTIASLLERMESNALLERFPHESDRRAHRIRLRPQGRRKFHEIREIAVALQTDVLGAIPASRRDAFLEHLAQVAEACKLASLQTSKSPHAHDT